MLTADLSGLADEDGTTQADNDAVGFAYTSQWVRVDGETETDIVNATAGTYTLAAEDQGKTVKVEVSFTDDADNDEGPLVSEALSGHGDHCPGGRQPPGHGGARDHGTAQVGQVLTAGKGT